VHRPLRATGLAAISRRRARRGTAPRPPAAYWTCPASRATISAWCIALTAATPYSSRKDGRWNHGSGAWIDRDGSKWTSWT